MRTASRVTSGPIPSPATTSTFNCIEYSLLRGPTCGSSCACSLDLWGRDQFRPAVVIREKRDQILVKNGLSVIRQLIETVIDDVKFGGIENKAQFLEPVYQGPPAGMLAQPHTVSGHAHRSRGHDLVSQRMRHHAVLMDACLVGEG